MRSIFDALLDNEQLTRAFLTRNAVDPAWTTNIHLTREYLTERLLAVLAEREDLPPSSEGGLAFALFCHRVGRVRRRPRQQARGGRLAFARRAGGSTDPRRRPCPEPGARY